MLTPAKIPGGLTAVLLLLCGCVNAHVHFPYRPDQLSVQPVAYRPTENVFAYTRGAPAVETRALDHLDTDAYRVFKLSFPSAGVNGQHDNRVDAWYFQSRGAGQKKLVFVLPIWGSYKYPSWQIAKGILNHDPGETSVVLLLGEDFLIDWDGAARVESEAEFHAVWKDSAERVRTMVLDLRRFVDWAEAQPEIDPRRIALVGFSVSAVVAGVALAAEPRFAAGVMVMGGAHPHETFATCFGRVGRAREAAINRFGWSVQRYRDELEPIFAAVDAARYPGRVDPSRVLIVDAHYDDCIPKSAREALWETMGRPERFSFLYRHKPAFLAMTPLGANYMRGRIYDFLQTALR